MADKRKLHHVLVVIRGIKLWQLIVLFIVLACLSAYFLRQNSLQMVELRNAVKMADERNEGLQQALSQLGAYVTTHMNTDLGQGIFLEQSYQRAYNDALKAAANSVNPNSDVYKQAESDCRGKFGSSLQLYVQCVQARVAALSPGADPTSEVKQPPVELFKHNFVSPKLSFDVAGVFVVATIFVGFLIVIRIASYFILKLALR